MSGLNICTHVYTLATENYSFENITTDLTQCPAYPAMTCISLDAMGGAFPFQIAIRAASCKHCAFNNVSVKIIVFPPAFCNCCAVNPLEIWEILTGGFIICTPRPLTVHRVFSSADPRGQALQSLFGDQTRSPPYSLPSAHTHLFCPLFAPFLCPFVPLPSAPPVRLALSAGAIES